MMTNNQRIPRRSFLSDLGTGFTGLALGVQAMASTGVSQEAGRAGAPSAESKRNTDAAALWKTRWKRSDPSNRRAAAGFRAIT